ncbi:MAG TPA: cupin domain-containing protein [Sulfurovum sp.]|uniref:cupin domain-containing protein n=1 Tax=Sulfurovum sp. TaxID=1969726 RepID=UPI002F93E9EA
MNLYDTVTPQSGETFTTLLAHKNIKINRIVSSENVEAAEYLQEEDEWLVLLEGKATLLLAEEERTLTKGDTLFIPSKTPHRVLDTQRGTLWLTVHIF